jgi:glucose-6-phosphate 1-dehydrogenase
VVEKPFGRDLGSARALNRTLAAHFDESQIYRIDHYLGKETVQNLMAVRFANILFEPLVEHRNMSIMSRSPSPRRSGVGRRGAYYDKSGAMRDMVQNHMMQLLCLIAMEPPYRFRPRCGARRKAEGDPRAGTGRAAQDIVRGQYDARRLATGLVLSAPMPKIRRSTTESYIAMKVPSPTGAGRARPSTCAPARRLRARAVGNRHRLQGSLPHSIFEDAVGWHRECA